MVSCTYSAYTFLEQKNHPLPHLVHHVPDHVLGEELVAVVVPFLHELVQVLLHVLEDEVEGVVLPDHLLQLDHVAVGQLLEGLDLAEVHRLLPRVVLPLHPLYGHLQGRENQT